MSKMKYHAKGALLSLERLYGFGKVGLTFCFNHDPSFQLFFLMSKLNNSRFLRKENPTKGEQLKRLEKN